MNKLTRLFLTLSILTFAGISYAGDHGHERFGKHPHDGERFFSILEKKLDLSDEQVTAIQAIREESHSGMKAKMHLKKGNSVMALDPESPYYAEEVAKIADEHAAKVRERIIQRAEMHAKISAILTPEQREKFKELQEKRREKMQKRMQKKLEQE